MMETPAALPFYGRGNFAPVDRELTTDSLDVEGSIPQELDGVYVRNGPNPLGHDYIGHWFAGDGMLHGVALSGGRASWYRNRYVRTKTLAEHRATLGSTKAGMGDNAANTNVIAHAGRIFALVENSLPTEVTPELETIGEYDFAGRLKTPFTAHPIICPITGEMHFFGYSPQPPFVTYHRADADGILRQSTVVDVKAPTMMHAFALSEVHAIFMDLPVIFDRELAVRSLPFRWSDDYGARLGLVRRGTMSEQVKWFEIDPCYAFHPLNAYEDGSDTVIDVVRYDEFWRGGPPSDRFESAYLHRWRIGANGRVGEQRLDDRTIEFPRADPRLAGLKHRFGYAIRTDDEGSGVGSAVIVKYDLNTGVTAEHSFSTGTLLSEFVFVPASETAGEDEGWLLGYAYSKTRDTSAIVILDAQSLARGPIATAWLPQRVPQGFHGNWIPTAALA